MSVLCIAVLVLCACFIPNILMIGTLMTEVKCPSCRASMDFKSVFFATNPVSIKCPGCAEVIKVNKLYAIPIAGLVAVVAFGLWDYVDSQGASVKQSILAMVALGLVVEYLYFELIRKGMVPSSLTKDLERDASGDTPSCDYKVVPRIKNKHYLIAAQREMNGVEKSIPITEPLAGDLVLAYAIDMGENYVALSESSAEEFNISMEGLRQKAEVAALPSLGGIRVNQQGKVSELACADNMTACSILFPEMWNQIEGEIGGPVVMSVPHRDTVLYARADDDEAVEELNVAMESFDFDEVHALSKLLFTRDGDAWRPLGV